MHHHSSIDVELSIAIRNLTTNNENTIPDPMCVVFNQPFGRGWQEYARTETQKDTRSPTFVNKIKIPYCFEERQILKFQVFDAESSSPSLGKHTYLGKVECTLAQIVSQPLFSANIKSKGISRGRLSVTVKEIGQNTREEIELKFGASHLKRNLPFAHLDPFLEIRTMNKSIYKTTWLSNTKNPIWPSIYIPLRVMKHQLNISCFHHSKDEEQHLIGEVQIDSNDLLKAPYTFTLKKHGHYKGELNLISSQILKIHSFLDFISSGLKLHCTFAIDFTEANGDPQKKDSLHHIGSEPNLYEVLLRSFAEVLQDYDNALLSLMGFGAQTAPLLHELHVENADSLTKAYRKCLQNIKLGGASCFTPSIEHVAKAAKNCSQDYFLLVILTSAEVSDFNKTVKAVTDASEHPLSIITLGVGDSEFETTTHLVDEVKKLRQHGNHLARENFQFARFKEYLDKYEETMGSFHLVEHMLTNIPNQLTTYMKMRQVLPKKNEILVQ